MKQPMSVLTSMATVECYTPTLITDRLPLALGGPVDLDPASCAVANRTVRATRFYTEADDGYMRDWRSPRLFLNPPFDDTPRWVRRLATAYAAGEVGAAVLLVNSAPGYTWWQELADTAPIVMLRERLVFLRADGTPYTDASGRPSAHKKGQTLAYFGPDLRAFLAAYGSLGRALLPGPYLAELVDRLDTLRDAAADALTHLPQDRIGDGAWQVLNRCAGLVDLASGSAGKLTGRIDPAPVPWEEVHDAAA